MLKEDIINREFFIIDSDNLSDVKDKLYGFSFKKSSLVQDDDLGEYEGLDNIGTFVLIQKNDDEVIISQDCIGTYGIYVYQKDDYFAISNSFIRLVEHLKINHEMTLNKDYAYISLLPRMFSTLIHEKTLVNEITCVPRNFKIHIDTNSKIISYEKINYNENSISLDSEEGLKLLDKWFYKWVEIIRSLKLKTNNISIDLSGGFDTRMILALILVANIDINSIRVYSIDNNQHSHPEDFRIASLIADEFGFKLNQDLDVDYYNYPDIQTVLDLSSYVKLGFNSQLNFKLMRPQDPIYMITGMGGGISRGWPIGDAQSQINDIVNKSKRFEPAFADNCERILKEGHESIRHIRPNIADDETFQWEYYKETRLRNHFGKLTVENYMSNNLALCPLIDPDLFKLKNKTEECFDNSLLMTLIFVRYCPKLLDFEVEGGREFDSDVVEYAKRINEIYPYEVKEYEFLSEVESEKNSEKFEENEKINWHDINKYLKGIFRSQLFRHEFMKYVPSRVYDKLSYSIENRDYFPLQDTIPAFAFVNIINAINFNENEGQEFVSDWFDSFSDDTYEITPQINPEFPLLVSKFVTARIDIKNTNSQDNSVEIIENSDVCAKVDFPDWLQNEKGGGCLIESMTGYLDVKLKCIGDGNLSVKLRGINAMDKCQNRYPVYIDYTKFEVNGKEIISKNTLLWHDDPFTYEIPVEDGEIISIHLEWLPINKESETGYYNNLFKENESLKKEIERLRKINEDMQNSTSWKVTKPLRKIKNR